MENEEIMKASKNLAGDIRKSKLSGKFYWDLWQQSDPSQVCKKALNYLTSLEKVTLAENVASLRHNCQSEKEFTSVYYCCYFLEKTRFGVQIYSVLSKNSVTITREVSQESWRLMHDKAKARMTELGLTTFQDAMQQKVQKLNQKPALKRPTFPQALAKKLTEPLKDFNKLPQSLLARIKSAFIREKPSKESHLKQQTEEFIDYKRSQKDKKL